MKKGSRIVWWLFWIPAALVIVYIGGCALVRAGQNKLVFHPMRKIEATPEAIGLDYEELLLDSGENDKICCWWVPAREPRGTLLFCHGNAGNISHRIDSIDIFHKLGLNVLIFDYRGYGRSTGKPTEAGVMEDAAAAWRHLTEERGIEPDRIVVFGRSLGGAVAAQLARDVQPAVSILESTFTSIPDVGTELYPYLPVRLLARVHMDTLRALSEVRCPVLVIHSVEDDLIPFHHGEELYAAAPEPKQLLPLRGSHVDGYLVSGRVYTDGIETFLQEHFDASS